MRKLKKLLFPATIAAFWPGGIVASIPYIGQSIEEFTEYLPEIADNIRYENSTNINNLDVAIWQDPESNQIEAYGFQSGKLAVLSILDQSSDFRDDLIPLLNELSQPSLVFKRNEPNSFGVAWESGDDQVIAFAHRSIDEGQSTSSITLVSVDYWPIYYGEVTSRAEDNDYDLTPVRNLIETDLSGHDETTLSESTLPIDIYVTSATQTPFVPVNDVVADGNDPKSNIEMVIYGALGLVILVLISYAFYRFR